MKLLLVGSTCSPHVARWLRQLDGLGWETHLFAAHEGAIYPTIKNVTVHSQLAPVDDCFVPAGLSSSVRVHSTSNFHWAFPRTIADAADLVRMVRDMPGPERKLAHLVATLRPDVVHSFETQRGGYLTLAARRLAPKGFPPWLHSLWGSDIYWFGRQVEHKQQIRAMMAAVDVLLADCERDIRLARDWGFSGAITAVVPGPGGFDLLYMRALRTIGPVCRRRVVAIKGYDDDRGRGSVAVEAVRRCAGLLGGYEIVVYGASPTCRAAAERLRSETALKVTIMPISPVEDIWTLMGRSRIGVGLALSDGTPNTMLEAMVMGAFPIQSATPGLEDWISHGENGLLVPAEDSEAVAAALRCALTDDALIDRADDTNAAIADRRLSLDVVTPRVVALYEAAASRA